MKTLAQYTVNFPTWALNALINSDSSGITEDEDKIIEQWELDCLDGRPERSFAMYDGWQNEASFCSNPEFGLACDCVELKVLICTNSISSDMPLQFGSEF